jgi:hypothetical protein
MSRPEQLADNISEEKLELTEDILTAIDEALTDPTHGDLAERSPTKTAKPFDVMPAWRL